MKNNSEFDFNIGKLTYSQDLILQERVSDKGFATLRFFPYVPEIEDLNRVYCTRKIFFLKLSKEVYDKIEEKYNWKSNFYTTFEKGEHLENEVSKYVGTKVRLFKSDYDNNPKSIFNDKINGRLGIKDSIKYYKHLLFEPLLEVGAFCPNPFYVYVGVFIKDLEPFTKWKDNELAEFKLLQDIKKKKVIYDNFYKSYIDDINKKYDCFLDSNFELCLSQEGINKLVENHIRNYLKQLNHLGLNIKIPDKKENDNVMRLTCSRVNILNILDNINLDEKEKEND